MVERSFGGWFPVVGEERIRFADRAGSCGAGVGSLRGSVLRCPGVGTQAAGLAVGLPGGRVGNGGLFWGRSFRNSANQDIITR